MTATVSTDRILRELADLWVSLGKQSDGDTSAGVLRACSMTLVVMADEADDFMALGETIAALMPEHPARAIVIRLVGPGSSDLAARVFSQCWMPFGGRRQICCEQVEITASDARLDELPALVLPLCVADLPVILWCRSPRLVGRPEFSQLASIARKVILDSALLGESRPALERLAAAVEHGMILGDLAWTRLTRHREILARLFENREYQSRIGELGRVEVRYGGTQAPTCAWYMAAWLSSALRDAGVGAAVAMERDPAAPEGRTSRVRLTGSGQPGFTIELAAKEGALTVKVDGLEHCTTLPRATDYLLMREELGIVRRDAIFERVLSSATRLALSSEVK